MNKKVIVLAVLLAVAGLALVRALFFSGPPSNHQPPEAAKKGNEASTATTTAAGPAGAKAAEGTPAIGVTHAPGPPLKPGASNVDVNLDELAKDVQVVEFQYDPSTLARNPMIPLVGPQAVLAGAGSGGPGQPGIDTDLLTQQMAVTGIIWDKKFPVAVINNDVVAPGDVLADGIKVKSIEQDKVILAVRDRLVTLPLKRLEER